MNDLVPSPPLPDSEPHTFDLSQAEPFERLPFRDLGLYIPGMTTPVLGFDGGINLAALDTHRDKGLLCLLPPYLDMAENDFIELFCRDLLAPVDTHTVTDIEADRGLQLPLYIPRTRLPDGTADPVFFRVTRAAGGNPEETRRFKLKVDTVRPGGRNPIASTFQNENLAKPIFPQDLIDFGVGEGDIGTPVPVIIDFYPVEDLPANTHRAVRDRIRLSIGGVIVEHRVTDGEAAGRQPITVMVNTGVWTEVGSGSHVCEYEIIDEVGNYSDGWSPAQILEVRLDDGAEPLLSKAYVEESDEHDVLDVDALEGSDATIIIVPHAHEGYLSGDILRVKVSGRTADNTTVVRFYEGTVGIIGRAVRVPWPFADIQPLVNGRAQITFERIRSGVPNRRSHSLLVGVIGTGVGTDLPAPVVHDAPGNVLPPDIPYLTVDVLSYLGQHPDDRVVLVLDGALANGSDYYNELSDRAGSYDEKVTFRLRNGPDGEIARLEGGTLRLYYKVINTEGTRTSEDIELDVGDPVASLPEPFLQEAPPPDYVFDPVLSPFELKVFVRKHADIQEGDTVTLHFKGTAPGGSFTPAPIKVIGGWVGVDLPFTIPRPYVLANLDRSASVYYTVKRENVRTRFSHAVTMRVGSALDLPVAYIYQSTVTGPSSATINPMQVINPPVVTVRVRYDGMKGTDDIQLYWVGTPGLGTPAIAPKPGAATGNEVDFSLPGGNSAVAANLGSSLKVYYEVTRGGRTTKSNELSVRVMSFAEIPGGNPLPPLQIEEARNGQIDVNGSVTFRVNEWPFFRQGDRVWLTLESENASGTTLRLAIWSGSPITATEFNQKYLRSVITNTAAHAIWLRQLVDGRQLRVIFKVVFGGGTHEADAQEFPPLRLNVFNKSDPVLALEEKFNGLPNQFITQGGTLDISRSMAIHLLESSDKSRTCGTYTYDHPVAGYLEGPALVINYNLPIGSQNPQRVKLTFKATYRKVSFTCSQRNQVLTVRFLDDSNTVLKTETLPRPASGFVNDFIEFAATPGTQINHVEVLSDEYLFFDFFKFYR